MRTTALGALVQAVAVVFAAAIAAAPARGHVEEPANPAAEALAFLQKHLPAQDRDTGITIAELEKTVELALEARDATKFAKAVPWQIFLNDVLPHRALTEPRDDWRQMLREWNAPLVADAANGSVAVEILNNRSCVFGVFGGGQRGPLVVLVSHVSQLSRSPPPPITITAGTFPPRTARSGSSLSPHPPTSSITTPS